MSIIDAQVHIWGSDSWRQCVTLFTAELPWLTAHHTALIMDRAVCNRLGWNIAG